MYLSELLAVHDPGVLLLEHVGFCIYIYIYIYIYVQP